MNGKLGLGRGDENAVICGIIIMLPGIAIGICGIIMPAPIIGDMDILPARIMPPRI
jgi:hypothetical protein